MFTPLKRIIKYGAKNFVRQGGLNFATIFILTMTLILISLLFLLEGMSHSLIKNIESKIDVSVYLNATTTQEEISQIKSSLSKLPEVKSVRYISSEEALEEFKKKHKNDPEVLKSLEIVGINPFYASINIQAKSPDQYGAILSFLQQPRFHKIIQKIDYIKKKTLIEKVSQIARNINIMGLSLILIFGGIAVLVAFQSIRIAINDSAQEISVMRLVGASNWYTRGPFIIQGILCGFIASVASFLLFLLTCHFVSSKLALITGGFNLSEWLNGNLLILVFLELILGIGLAVGASMAAVRKYLKT